MKGKNSKIQLTFGHEMAVQSMMPFQNVVQGKIRDGDSVAHEELFAAQIIGQLQKFRVYASNSFFPAIFLK